MAVFMHITRQGIFALSLAGVFAMACSKKSESDGVADASATPSSNEVVVQVDVENVPVVPPIDVAVVAVEPRAFDPANYPGTTPRGEVLGGFSFVDSAGENFVIFTRDTKERDDHIYEATLHIHHVAKLNDEVRTVRTYIERVADCEFDVILNPFFGDWSVTDVNQDGVGEASFAYRVGCVSDISPVGHKAFVTQGGEKYVLRGVSRLEFPGMEPEGGTYTADTMPDVFLMKAKEVWELTVASSHHE